MASSQIILLKDEKLRELAQLLRDHEVYNIQNIQFESPGKQYEYLRMCNSNQQSVNTLLDSCNASVIRHKKDAVRGPIAGLILVYAEHCLNSALQLFNNYTLRKTYLDKIDHHMQQLFKALDDELDTSDPTEVADFTQQIQQLDQKIVSYMKMSVNTYASQEFSRYLKNIGISFDDLIRSYQAKLGFAGRFKDLKEEQKLEVYSAIVEASGRLNVIDEKGLRALKIDPEKVIGYGSKAMLLYNVAKITWDIYVSDRPLKTATREAIVLAAKLGGAALGKIVGVAIATQLVGVEATALFVTLAGLVGGILGGFIFGAAAGFLFDLIFGSGGQEILPTDGIVVYVAEMPNGLDLAKKIAYV